MAYSSKFKSKETEGLFEAILTLESKEECYSAMREDAMASINSFASSDSEMQQHQKVAIEFQPDAIWVDVGYDIHYTYNIVEC